MPQLFGHRIYLGTKLPLRESAALRFKSLPKGYWALGYDEAMELSQLPSLETQRNRATLCFLCNIVHQNMDFEVLTTTTWGHNFYMGTQNDMKEF